MPSTDIDGSPIMILGEKEAKALYSLITSAIIKGYQPSLTILEICTKIATTFNIQK